MTTRSKALGISVDAKPRVATGIEVDSRRLAEQESLERLAGMFHQQTVTTIIAPEGNRTSGS